MFKLYYKSCKRTIRVEAGKPLTATPSVEKSTMSPNIIATLILALATFTRACVQAIIHFL